MESRINCASPPVDFRFIMDHCWLMSLYSVFILGHVVVCIYIIHPCSFICVEASTSKSRVRPALATGVIPPGPGTQTAHFRTNESPQQQNKQCTDRKIPQNVLLLREPRSRCIVLVHPTPTRKSVPFPGAHCIANIWIKHMAGAPEMQLDMRFPVFFVMSGQVFRM